MGNQSLKDFYDQQTDADRSANKESVGSAGTESSGKTVKVGVSGKYLMEVNDIAFVKDGELKVFPTYGFAKTGSLMITLNLVVVDGTDLVPKGASIFTNIPILPSNGASKETHDNIAKVMKPKIFALTGQKDFDVSIKWVEEDLLPTYEDKDGKAVLVKDHKMKKQIMVDIEDGVYEGRPTLNVNNMYPVKEGDKSESTKHAPGIETKAPEGNAAAPSAEDYGTIDTNAAPERGSDDVPATETLAQEPEDF